MDSEPSTPASFKPTMFNIAVRRSTIAEQAAKHYCEALVRSNTLHSIMKP
jgi:hypothetical protein